MKKRFVYILSSVAFSLVAASAFAEEAQKTENTDPMDLKSGVIASSGNAQGNQAFDADTGDSAPGGATNLVSASISKVSRGKCSVNLKNSSDKSGYSVRYRVVGVSESGREVMRRFYSARLAPSGSDSRSIDCADGLSLRVELVSGKRTS